MSINIRIKKKYIIAAILALLFGIITSVTSVHAEETEEPVNTDKTYISYMYIYGDYGNSEFTVKENVLVALYWCGSSGEYKIEFNYSINGVVHNAGILPSNIFIDGGVMKDLGATNINVSVTSTYMPMNYFADKSFTSDKYMKTNIPIFATEEQATQYLATGEGIEDSVNWEDLTDIRYDLEVPQNLKIEYSDGIFEANKYSMFWEQTDENYKNWETEIYIYVTVNAWEGILGIKVGDTVTYEDMALLGDTIPTYKLKYVIDTGSDKYGTLKERVMNYIWNDNPRLTGASEDYYKIYIRNAYFDGELRHYSNWLLVEIDYDWENGDESSTVVELEGNINDTPGEGKPGDDIKGEVNTESQYDGTVDGNVIDSSGDILSWIKNGFGLLGDDGLISLLSECLSFIPDEVWTILYATISICAVVAIFKFVRG